MPYELKKNFFHIAQTKVREDPLHEALKNFTPPDRVTYDKDGNAKINYFGYFFLLDVDGNPVNLPEHSGPIILDEAHFPVKSLDTILKD